ncbi:MAG: hypothetical protein WDA60_07100 [Acidimicrobiia bacterium]|jgi:hypothetical protein
MSGDQHDDTNAGALRIEAGDPRREDVRALLEHHLGFAPARALYAGMGFAARAPFGDYRPSPNRVCMTLPIA